LRICKKILFYEFEIHLIIHSEKSNYIVMTNLVLLNVNWSIESDFHESTKIRFSSEMCIRQSGTVAIEEMSV